MTFNTGPQHKMVFPIFRVPSLPGSLSILYLSQLGPQKSVTTLNTPANTRGIQVPVGKTSYMLLESLMQQGGTKSIDFYKGLFIPQHTHTLTVHTSHNGLDKFSPLPILILRKQLTPLTTNDTFKISARNGSEYSDSALLGCDIAQTVRYLMMFRDWMMSQPNGPQQYKISLPAYYAVSNNKQFPTFRRIVQPPSSRPGPHSFRITTWYLPTPKKALSSGPPLR